MKRMQSDNGLAVTLSVRGRFHAFDLARELHRRGALRLLIGSYPKYKVREWGIPASETVSLTRFEVLNRLIDSRVFPSAVRTQVQISIAFQFDRAAARRIPENTRLFVGWSGSSRRSIRRAKALGAKTIVERGSAHIAFQDCVLNAAFAAAGFRWHGIAKQSLDAEAQEYGEADFISVPTCFARDTFVHRGFDPGRIIVTPYGCDLDVFRPQPKRDGIFRVIHCGLIGIQKGVHLLVQAFAELNLPRSELWLIGAVTPEMAIILARYRDSRIKVMGPFPQSSLPQYYSQGSVFCLASFHEGMAMVIPQAMSCGLPVIATANSGASEVVEEGRTGYIIAAGDLEALKEKLTALNGNPGLRDQMAANLNGAQKRDISWNAYGERIIRSYRDILRRQPPTGAGSLAASVARH
jgi:glycosyltransferase involved in cell wall biosynthesis